MLLGSLTLAQALMRLNLIDDYRINVNPVILGSGVPLFGSLGTNVPLKLVGARLLMGGVNALHYEPVRE